MDAKLLAPGCAQQNVLEAVKAHAILRRAVTVGLLDPIAALAKEATEQMTKELLEQQMVLGMDQKVLQTVDVVAVLEHAVGAVMLHALIIVNLA